MWFGLGVGSVSSGSYVQKKWGGTLSAGKCVGDFVSNCESAADRVDWEITVLLFGFCLKGVFWLLDCGV